jgi:N-acyl homoserine lactone hydrolase
VTSVRRLYVLLCGFEIMRKTISTRDLGGRFVLSEPISAYLLDTAEGWILLDAGFDRAAIAGPQNVQAFFDRTGCYPPVVGDDHLIERQLAEIGVAPSEVRKVILSHMHNDHTGFLKHLPRAEVWVQRAEHEHAHAPGLPGGFSPADYRDLGLDWRLVEGDWQVMPGLRMISTRGHTPGHQSAVVELPNTGCVVLPFDVGDLAENFADEVLPGASCDDIAALASIRRIKALVVEHQAQMILFHDPTAIQSVRLAPACYD